MRAPMDRRDFLGRFPVVSACACLVASSGGCVGLRYVRATEEPGRLVLPRAALGEDVGVLVESSRTPKPVYLRTTDPGAYSAVLVECTHRQCQPEPEGDRLVCPCHGSEFAFTGEVLQGPAEAPLTRFRVSHDRDSITIWLVDRGTS